MPAIPRARTAGWPQADCGGVVDLAAAVCAGGLPCSPWSEYYGRVSVIHLNSLSPTAWPLVLTIAEVQSLTGLSRSSVLRLIQAGDLDEVRFGHLDRRQVSRASVLRLL